MRRTGSVMPATVWTIDGLAAAVVDTAVIAMKIGDDNVENRMPSRANDRPTLYRAA